MKVIVKQPEDIYRRCCRKHISARDISGDSGTGQSRIKQQIHKHVEF